MAEALVRARYEFNDLEAGVLRRRGDEFAVSAARLASLEVALPGYVTVVGERPGTTPADGDDLGTMTAAQLAALCRERGVDVPKRASKATLLKLLGE